MGCPKMCYRQFVTEELPPTKTRQNMICDTINKHRHPPQQIQMDMDRPVIPLGAIAIQRPKETAIKK